MTRLPNAKIKILVYIPIFQDLRISLNIKNARNEE
jgi:hypothetical protein